MNCKSIAAEDASQPTAPRIGCFPGSDAEAGTHWQRRWKGYGVPVLSGSERVSMCAWRIRPSRVNCPKK